MIEDYFQRADVLIRLQSGPVGPYLPGFLRALEQRRFSHDSIRRYVRGADTLCRWLDGQGIALVEANQKHIEAYVCHYARLPDNRYIQGRLSKAASSLPRIATLLGEQGILCGCVPLSKPEEWLARFDNHLMRVHGISRNSRDNYVRYARGLIQSLQMNDPDWSVLNGQHISDFVCREAAKLKSEGGCHLLAAAVRAVLRFLVAEGALPPNLDRAIPVIRLWQHASLPQHFSTEELEQILETCRTATVGRLRDGCIVLMMARLGMRAGEVRQLKLEDIDWIEGVIRVRLGKSRRERTLPLLEDIGTLLSAYLRQERPESTERSIFLTSLPPYRPLAWSTAISRISKGIFKEAGLEGPRLGAHRLRHSVATHLVRRGSSFKEIADLLGHKSMRSTGIYAKLDQRGLEQVALPWPGGAR